MKRLIAVAVLGIPCSAFADQLGEQKYSELMTGMEVHAAGMCDQMRSTLVEYRSSDGKLAHELVALSNTRYVVVVVPGDPKPTKYYFAKRSVEQNGKSIVDIMLYENPMTWSTSGRPALMQESPNFFSFHFGLRQSDCGLSAPIKKGKEQN